MAEEKVRLEMTEAEIKEIMHLGKYYTELAKKGELTESRLKTTEEKAEARFALS